MILIVAALVLVVCPLLLALLGVFRARSEPPATAVAWDWGLVALSALLYTVAFNLVFFVQELFLVLPKAFTPGLQPTLFHNNRLWEGEHPLASLFQGTGALATFLLGSSACCCCAGAWGVRSACACSWSGSPIAAYSWPCRRWWWAH